MYEARLAAIASAVREGDVEYGDHMLDQISLRGVSRRTIEAALNEGDPEIIEDYPADPRGACCLVRCITSGGRVLHLVVSYPPSPVLITAWWPDEEPHRWDAAFRRRLR